MCWFPVLPFIRTYDKPVWFPNLRLAVMPHRHELGSYSGSFVSHLIRYFFTQEIYMILCFLILLIRRKVMHFLDKIMIMVTIWNIRYTIFLIFQIDFYRRYFQSWFLSLQESSCFLGFFFLFIQSDLIVLLWEFYGNSVHFFVVAEVLHVLDYLHLFIQ